MDRLDRRFRSDHFGRFLSYSVNKAHGTQRVTCGMRGGGTMYIIYIYVCTHINIQGVLEKRAAVLLGGRGRTVGALELT